MVLHSHSGTNPKSFGETREFLSSPMLHNSWFLTPLQRSPRALILKNTPSGTYPLSDRPLRQSDDLRRSA